MLFKGSKLPVYIASIAKLFNALFRSSPSKSSLYIILLSCVIVNGPVVLAKNWVTELCSNAGKRKRWKQRCKREKRLYWVLNTYKMLHTRKGVWELQNIGSKPVTYTKDSRFPHIQKLRWTPLTSDSTVTTSV